VVFLTQQKEKPDVPFLSLVALEHIELSLTFSVVGISVAQSGDKNNKQSLSNS
jgi:hypothetical protein